MRHPERTDPHRAGDPLDDWYEVRVIGQQQRSVAESIELFGQVGPRLSDGITQDVAFDGVVGAVEDDDDGSCIRDGYSILFDVGIPDITALAEAARDAMGGLILGAILMLMSSRSGFTNLDAAFREPCVTFSS